jgi:hypothetical protein
MILPRIISRLYISISNNICFDNSIIYSLGIVTVRRMLLLPCGTSGLRLNRRRMWVGLQFFCRTTHILIIHYYSLYPHFKRIIMNNNVVRNGISVISPLLVDLVVKRAKTSGFCGNWPMRFRRWCRRGPTMASCRRPVLLGEWPGWRNGELSINNGDLAMKKGF